MAVATAPVLDPPSSPAAATGGGAKALFAFKALRDGRTVMELSAFEGDAEEIRVEAEIYSVRAGDDEKGQRRSLVFPTGEQARKFVDEALITFEYMGCTIKDLVSGSQSARSPSAPAIAA